MTGNQARRTWITENLTFWKKYFTLDVTLIEAKIKSYHTAHQKSIYNTVTQSYNSKFETNLINGVYTYVR